MNLISVGFEKGFRILFVYAHARQMTGPDFDEISFKFPPDNMNLKEGVSTVIRKNLDHVVKHMGDIVRGGNWPDGLGLNLNDFY
ncbi:MAG: hypothetical protein HWE24_20655 [Oceanospirillaceae bacterium]|nr:hypothetical protein [Oceanospirillaceae bacterium]